MSNEKTKDGLAKDLFPLTTEVQKDYAFTLLGQEVQEGRNVYHIGFRPKDKDDISWAGEAYIDAAEFRARASLHEAVAAHTIRGPDPSRNGRAGRGFNVVYKRQEDGVWFPATFGTEFRIRALFFINREVSIALENSAFERTHVKSNDEGGWACGVPNGLHARTCPVTLESGFGKIDSGAGKRPREAGKVPALLPALVAAGVVLSRD